MANSLKIKLGIAGVAILVLLLVPLLENKFFAPVTIKRFGKISWDDFQGIPPPFSSHQAAISSSIHLEYDSTKKKYVAYAGQHDVASWVRGSHEGQDYLLNHEQYHFNITELHARMLNDYIGKNPDGTLEEYLARLRLVEIDLRWMQRDYDNETDHSLIYDRQRLWEFRIDSLLRHQTGWLTDPYSGAQVYMPHPSDSSKGIINGIPYRSYLQNRYGMKLSIVSYQNPGISYRGQVQQIKRNLVNRAERVKTFTVDTTTLFRVFAISEDTSSYTSYQLWTTKGEYLYQCKAVFFNATGDTTGYSTIASSFISSFRVVETDDHWISKPESSDSKIIVTQVVKKADKRKMEEDEYCISIGPSTAAGFYRGPIYRDDGAILIAYEYLLHPDSLHYRDGVMLNEKWYWTKPGPTRQIFFVPTQHIPKGKFTIDFGYLLSQDSAKECYHYYYDRLEVESK
jgi:hypothetical protein